MAHRHSAALRYLYAEIERKDEITCALNGLRREIPRLEFRAAGDARVLAAFVENVLQHMDVLERARDAS